MLAEAEEVWGLFGAPPLSGTSRSRDRRTRSELGWTPHYTDMLSEIGEARPRALAAASTDGANS